MNKDFLKKAAAVMTAATMLGTTAFAVRIEGGNDGINYDSSSKTLTVQYADVTTSEQASLLVYNVSDALTALSTPYADQATTPIVAIDQEAGDGSFMAALPDSVEAGKTYVVKVGASGSDSPAVGIFTVPEDDAVDYGNVDGDPGVGANDVNYIFSRFKGALSDADIQTNLGMTAADFDKIADVDGSGAVDANDVNYVFSKFKGALDKFPAESGTSDNNDPTPSTTPSETPSDTPSEDNGTVTSVLSVAQDSLEVGAYTGTEDKSVTVSENDDCTVSVVADADKGNVIKISDSGSKQATLKFDLGDAIDGIIRYTASYKFDVADTSGDDAKDAILLRLQNTDVTPAITNSDGRFADIKTAKSGTQYELKYSDYFTANGTKATDTSTGIKLDLNTWYDITVEVDTNTNLVKIAAKDTTGKSVGYKEIQLPSDAEISLKNASITTKGSNTAATDIYVSNPSFGTADKSMSNPSSGSVETEQPNPGESQQPDAPTPDGWTAGVSDKVWSKADANEDGLASIPLNPNDEMWLGFLDITSTANRNGITFYMDQSRSIESSGGTTTDGASGKLAAQSNNAGSILAPYNFGSGISFCTSASTTSLFEGLMVKTADGQNVYVSPTSKVGILISDTAKPEVGYLADGTEVTIVDLPEQTPTYTEPYQKVMGFKVSGTCIIKLISAGRDSRQFLFTDKDGNILNVDKDGNPTRQAESVALTDADGQLYFGASYDGGEGEIYVSCPAGGIPMFGLEIIFPED